MIRRVRILMLLVCAHSCKRLALDPRGLRQICWLVFIFFCEFCPASPSSVHSFARVSASPPAFHLHAGLYPSEAESGVSALQGARCVIIKALDSAFGRDLCLSNVKTSSRPDIADSLITPAQEDGFRVHRGQGTGGPPVRGPCLSRTPPAAARAA